MAFTVSIMRVMAMTSLLAGVVVAILGMLRNEDLTQVSLLAGVFVSHAFVGKAVQKHIEVRSASVKSKN